MKRRIIIRIARRLLTVVIVFAALLAVLFTAATTPWFQSYLRNRIVQSLQQTTGGRIEVKGFHYRPLLFEVDVGHVTIHGREAPAEPPLFEGRQIEARISPSALFHYRLVLRSFRWAGARISIRTLPDGGTNIPGPAVGPSFGFEETFNNLASFSIRRVQLNGTEIEINSRHLPAEIEASSLTLSLRALRGHGYSGTVSASPINLHGAFGNVPAISFASQFSLGRKGLDIRSLRWNTNTIDGTGEGSLAWSPALLAEFKFRAAGRIADLAHALHLGSLRDGRFQLEGQGSYRDSAWKVAGHVRGRQLVIQLPGLKAFILDVSTGYAADSQKIILSPLSAEMFQGRAEGSTEVSLRGAEPEFEFRGSVHGMSVSAVLSGLAGSHSTLQLLHPEAVAGGAIEAKWRGPFKDFHTDFNLGLEAPAAMKSGGLPISGNVSGSAEYDRSLTVRIKSAKLQLPHSEIEAHGDLGAGNHALQVRLETTSFEEWRPLIDLYTETAAPIHVRLIQPAGFTGTLTQTAGSPSVEGQLNAGRFEFQGWEWDGFEAEIKLAPGGASLNSARLRHGSSVLNADASTSLDHWKFEPTSNVKLVLSAHRSPIEALRAALGITTPISGLFSGEISLGGTRDDLAGTGKFEVTNGRIDKETFDSVSARLEVAHSAWKFDDAVIRKGNAKGVGSVAIDFQKRTYSAAFNAEKIQIADLLSAARLGTGGRSILAGTADLNLRSEGSFDSPQGTLTASVAELRIEGKPVGQVQAQAGVQGNSITGSLKAQGAGGELELSGSIVRNSDWPLSLTGSFSKVRLDPWMEMLSQGQAGPPMSASGNFTLTGPIKDPAKLEGHGSIQSLVIDFPNLSFRNESPVEVSYSQQTVRIGALHLRGPSTNFEVKGSVRISETPAISIDATGQADAALLRLLDPKIQASGHSDLKVQVSGTFSSPLVRGSLAVRDVNLGYADTPVRVTNLNGTFDLQGDRAVISHMTGTVGAGTMSLSGAVTLGQLPRYDIAIGLDEVRVRYPADFTSVLDGRIDLRGTSERGSIAGDLVLRNVFVSQGVSLLNLLGPGAVPSESQTISSPFASQIALDVRVTSSPAVQIETRDVRLVADVGVRIGGSLATPVILGAVRARSGSAVFRGNRYAITRGDIEFSNPFRTEPTLDLEVQTRVQSYDLSVQMTGPLDRLRFSYRSDPPLATEDILSLLAFGYAQRNQGVGTVNSRSVSSSVGASAVLSEALSSQVSGRIQELFGVSRIQIDPNLDEPGAGAGPRVTVEQQLSPELTLTYSTSTANSQYRVIQFEWDVSQDVSVIGTRDYNGIFGLEIRFRKRFK